MQTHEGKTPRGLVSSELCAYFEHCFVEKVLERIGQEAGKWLEEVASLLGQDAQIIDYPFLISIDHDAKHQSVLRLLLSPTVPYPAVLEDDSDAVLALQQWNTSSRAAKSTLGEATASGQVDSGTVAAADVKHHELCSLGSRSQSRQVQDEAAHPEPRASEKRSDKGVHPSVWRPRCSRHRRFLWQQLAPLPKSAPELHSLIEHANGTVKREVKATVASLDGNDGRIFQLKCYQDWVEAAVQQKLSGSNGRKHVRGSLKKLAFVATWMAADEGAELDVPDHLLKYCRSEEVQQQGGKKRCKRSVVKHGLAGAKPPNQSWW